MHFCCSFCSRCNVRMFNLFNLKELSEKWRKNCLILFCGNEPVGVPQFQLDEKKRRNKGAFR